MSGLAKILVTILTVVVLGSLLGAIMLARVPPMEIGVRQAQWGGGGIAEEDFTTGTYLGITGVHKWFYLPRRTHFLHFSGQPGRGRGQEGSRPPGTTTRGLPTAMWRKPMDLRTTDGNLTEVDLTVPYRIMEGMGWRIVSDGILGNYMENVRTKVESVLRNKLSKLTSEDLQSTEKRLELADKVLPDLNKELVGFYVQADAILIRRVSFPAQYESKLQEKQYFTQKALLDGALTLQADEEKITNSIEKQIEAEIKGKTETWNKRLQEEKSSYEVKIAQVEADARVYETRVRAEGEAEAILMEAQGQLEVDKAEALRNELRNAILNTTGGRIYLALQAADNLQIKSVMLNSNDPRVPMVLDLEEMSKLLVGSDGP
jgi:regulator of protease activity HflC (stomatin/prohibitin superfamily)